MRTASYPVVLTLLCLLVFGAGLRCYSQSNAPAPGVPPVASTAVAPNVVAGGNAVQAKPLEAHPATPSYTDDPKFQEALAKAKEPRIPVDERLGRWKNANKIAKGECVECLRQMIQLQVAQAQWKDVANTCTQLEDVATTPKEKFYAESERGTALMHSNNDEPKPEQVKEAEASMRSALEITPGSSKLIYLEGRALAMMGRDDEAKAMFQRYLDRVKASDPYRTRVEHFIENPRLAAMRMAPAFTLTTSDGTQMSLDDMGGKVVLLDFWATWCGPCKESLPEIRKIVTKFADQPLVVLSISIDHNETAWKRFITSNKMTWPQYLDANGALSNAYGASSIPRFFTINTDGALESMKIGAGSNVEGEVKKLLKEAEKKKAKEADRTTAGG